MKALTGCVDGSLHIVEIHPSCAVVVILYHAAYRNVNSKLAKNLQGNVYLAPASIHQDQVRKSGKAVEFPLGFMGKTPCKHLFHACVIIWSLHPFDLEFAVITALGLAFFINHHGAY